MTGAPKKQERLDDQRLFGSSSFASQSAARSAPQTEVPSCSQQHQRAAQQHGKFRSRFGTHGHLFRLDINLSRWGGRSFLFREARFKQTYADEATPWSPTERRQPFSIWGDRSRRPVPVQGPPPLLLYPSPSVLRSPILGVFTKLADVLVMWPNKSPLVSCHISR